MYVYVDYIHTYYILLVKRPYAVQELGRKRLQRTTQRSWKKGTCNT